MASIWVSDTVKNSREGLTREGAECLVKRGLHRSMVLNLTREHAVKGHRNTCGIEFPEPIANVRPPRAPDLDHVGHSRISQDVHDPFVYRR